MKTVEFCKSIPVVADYDVIVAGAGPAGICAAVAASREGAKVALVERYGVIGGNLSVGHVGPILGMVSKGTMRDEIVKLLGVPENDMIGEVGVAHDMERAKRVLAEFVDCENITVFLQSSVSDVIMNGSRITGLIISCKEGLRAIRAKVIIDSTGDGDVAALSGAEFQKGRDDGLMQPVTHEFTLVDVDESKAIVCIGDVDDVKLGEVRFLDYCKSCADKGDIPANLAAVRLHRTSTPGERQVNTTQMNKIDSTCTSDLFKAEVELRKQIKIIADFVKTHLPGYENCKVASSGDTIGVRESRRVMGEYLMTREDIVEGRRFDDVVVHKAEFIVDIHNPDGAGQAEAKIQYCNPYDLPYRVFVPLRIDGLLMAGRCISGTHDAHASYRVMSICMAMGEAVGIAASICAKLDILPRDLDYRSIQKVLIKKGVDLFSK
jgi:Flavoprotein involved in thiazole biosynthesis